MIRSVLFVGVAFSSLVLAVPTLAADYGATPDLRSSFDALGQSPDDDNPLSFDVGVRYWYSWGAQNFAINSGRAGDPGTMSENDNSQSAEGYFRIDDASTHTYLKGLAGMAFETSGTATDNFGSTPVVNGRIGYAGADFGYSWLSDDKASFGPFLGYMYWNDSPNTFSNNFTTASSAADVSFDPTTGQTTLPGDSTTNSIDMNMLRIGLSGKVDLGQYFDVTGEVAAVPYAKISGRLGATSGAASGAPVIYDNHSDPSYGPVGPTGAFNIHDMQSSPTSIDGWGYGAMAEMMVGFHPTSNLSFGLGGRAWYVQGTADATYSRAQIGDPTDSVQPVAPSGTAPGNLNPPNFDTAPKFSNQSFISRGNPFSVFRYGLLAQMSYSF